MKKQILTIGIAILFAIGSTTFISCGNQQNNEGDEHDHSDVHAHEHTTEEHAPQGTTATYEGEKAKDLSLILESYFSLKNALVKDDAETAAEASEKLLARLNGFDMSVVSTDKMKEYMEIMEDAVENTEHISENADKIDHQREHFVNLSDDMNDLLALIGTDKKLYRDFCPMANDGKGAIWISETKEIQNPYMGTKMPTCGKIQKEW
ncbi:MAG: DUF3347 domain-containing protein [Bacteroidetes bacterium]|nr:DUF3347 domain-containing protein [Bacteroidota bacterium]